MSFLKKIARNVAQAIFCLNQYIIFITENVSSKKWATSSIFRRTAQRKQSPNGRKLAQIWSPWSPADGN
jgi:hypothetical protein